MPAFRHARNTRLLIGSTELSSQFKDFGLAEMMDQAETTAFGSTFKSFLCGMGDATLSLTGMFSGGVADADAILSAAFGQDTPTEATVAIEGSFTPPSRVGIMDANVLHYELKSSVSSIVEVVANLNATGGGETAFSLQDLVATAALSGTPVLGTVVDTGLVGGSTAGGFAVMHVTAVTGAPTSVTVALKSATTSGGTYSTFATLANFSAASSQRLLIAPVTINQFIKTSITASGGTTPTATLTVALVRF